MTCRSASLPCRAGQAMVEYLVLLALVLTLIAVPVDGHASVLAAMLDAVHTAYQKFLAALALPQ
jgi:hypothetical protein